MLNGQHAISWVAGGYVRDEPWLAVVVNAILWSPLLLVVWIIWRVFRSGPKPARDCALTWVTLAASALCIGVAYPRDPLMLIPAALAALLSVGCSVRAWRSQVKGLRGVVIAAWVTWLPTSVVLMAALR